MINNVYSNDTGSSLTPGMIQLLMPSILQFQSPGLKIVKIAHDMQIVVGRYVKQDLKLLNSFDTWHGIKLSTNSVVCFHWFNYTVKEQRMLLRSL